MNTYRSLRNLIVSVIPAIALALSGVNVHAQSVQVANAATSNLLSSTYPFNFEAAKFLVGANGIDVSSVVIPLSGGIDAEALFYAGDSAQTAPTSMTPIATSTPQYLPSTSGGQPVNITFDFPTPVALSADTTYWVAFGAVTPSPFGSNIYVDYLTTVDNSDSVDGTAIAQGALSHDGSSWQANGSDNFHYTIYGEAASDSTVPEPGAIALGSILIGMIGSLTLRRRRREALSSRKRCGFANSFRASGV